jgi:hypothetical protein
MVSNRSVGVCAVVLCLSAPPAVAQNLFEVQVFPDETIGRGEMQVEFQNVVIPAWTAHAGAPAATTGHVHVSVELTRGWTDWFETGVFLETAPDVDDRHPSLAGWHVRPKFRIGAWQRFPFHVSASVEYAFFENAGDRTFRQAVTITPIFEHHSRSWELSLNPGFEIPVRGPDAGSGPVFEPSAKLATRAAELVSVGVEYYAETGSIRHIDPVSAQQHLVFGAVDVGSKSVWNFNVGLGRGLTGGTEHWVLKSILGVKLPP